MPSELKQSVFGVINEEGSVRQNVDVVKSDGVSVSGGVAKDRDGLDNGDDQNSGIVAGLSSSGGSSSSSRSSKNEIDPNEFFSDEVDSLDDLGDNSDSNGQNGNSNNNGDSNQQNSQNSDPSDPGESGDP